MLTSFADDEALVSAVMAGAAGYVLKDVRGNDLVASIRSVAEGKSLLDPASTQRLLDHLRGGVEKDTARDSLTPQENRILDLIAMGYTNRQIGSEMHLAEKTVKNYVSNLLSKLGMSRRTEAAVYAARMEERQGRDKL
jgi:DNA-binding NarL/FixJ family response regulator